MSPISPLSRHYTSSSELTNNHELPSSLGGNPNNIYLSSLLIIRAKQWMQSTQGRPLFVSSKRVMCDLFHRPAHILNTSLSNEGFCTWPDTSSRSKKVVHWSLQQSGVSCREDSGSVAVVSIIPVSSIPWPRWPRQKQEAQCKKVRSLHYHCSIIFVSTWFTTVHCATSYIIFADSVARN